MKGRVLGKAVDFLGGVSTTKAARTAQYKQMFQKGGAYYGQRMPMSARKAYAQKTRSMVAAAEKSGRRRLYAATGMTAMGAGTMMRPNPNQQQTMYRGPMNTGRGVGRYS